MYDRTVANISKTLYGPCIAAIAGCLLLLVLFIFLFNIIIVHVTIFVCLAFMLIFIN